MNWDIEFNQLTDCYQLAITDPNIVYDLDSESYESALDEASTILERIGFYSEA